MHKTIAAATMLLTVAGVCLAQPPGITPEMIERSLPVEGAPLEINSTIASGCSEGTLLRSDDPRIRATTLSSVPDSSE